MKNTYQLDGGACVVLKHVEFVGSIIATRDMTTREVQEYRMIYDRRPITPGPVLLFDIPVEIKKRLYSWTIVFSIRTVSGEFFPVNTVKVVPTLFGKNGTGIKAYEDRDGNPLIWDDENVPYQIQEMIDKRNHLLELLEEL